MKLKVSSRVIKLYSGEFVYVDREDYEYLSQFQWYLFKSEKWTYAVRSQGDKTIFMHREIMGIIDPKVYVDHRDRNGLNNRKKNLRVGDNRQNQYNVVKKKNSTQKYKCIRETENHKFEVRMRLPDKTRFCKRCDTEEEAVGLYNELALKYHGEFAVLQDVAKHC